MTGIVKSGTESMSSAFNSGRFIGASATISAVRLAGRGALFAAALVASRHLPAASFGVYVYVMTFFTALNLVGALGLEQSTLIALGRCRATRDPALLRITLSRIVKRAICTLPIASLLFAIPIASVLPDIAALCCFVITGCCLAAIVIAAGVLRGVDCPVASSVVQECGRGLVIFLGVLMLFFRDGLAGVWTLTLVFAGLSAFACISAAVYSARQVQREMEANTYPARQYSDQEVQLPTQFRFLLVLIATNAFLWTCPVILKHRAASIAEVAIFNVAMQFPSLISFISTSLEMIYVPKIASAWQAGQLEDMRPFLRIGSRVTIAACIPIVVLLALFWRQLLAFYGPEYGNAGSAMLLIAAAQLISAACGPCGYIVLLTGRVNLNLAGMASAAMVGVVLLLLFAGPYGHLGAALALFFSIVLPNLFFAVYCIRTLRINPTIVTAFSASPLRQGADESCTALTA